VSPALLRSESAHPFLCGTLIAIGKRTKSQCNGMSVGTGRAGATFVSRREGKKAYLILLVVGHFEYVKGRKEGKK
jgi:hypothetical protein